MRVVSLSVLLLACAAVSADRVCSGAGDRSDLDDWCNLNCNFAVPWCPEEMCVCEDDTPVDTPTTACRGVTSALFDDWCDLNCNHEPAYCPSEYCACGPVDADTDDEPEEPAPACSSLSQYLSDEWCQNMCTFDPPFCPAAYCTCDDGSITPTINVVPHTPGCCENTDVVMFYVDDGSLYRQMVSGDTNEVMGDRTLCGSFQGAHDVEIDVDGNIFVTDPVAASVTRINPDCTMANTVTAWPQGPIDIPYALAIGHGGLYISGTSGIYFAELDEFFNAASITRLTWTEQNVDAIDMYNGQIYFVDQGASVKVYNPDTQMVWTYFDVNELRIVDIKDIDVSDCGVYISVTDANQLWYCEDPMNGTTCSQACNTYTAQDGSSCWGMNNPFGLAVDCECNAYSAQKGNGNILFSSYNETSDAVLSQVVVGGTNNPTDVEIFVTNECVPPVTVEYCIFSAGPGAPYVGADGTVFVAIVASAEITEPTVQCNGRDVESVESLDGGMTWTAEFLVLDSDADESEITCTITGYTGPDTAILEDPVPSVGCGAVVDNTHPTVEYCITSDNAFPDDELAADGDMLTVTVVASEAVTIPTVMCGGTPFALTDDVGNGLQFVFQAATPDSLADGDLTCTVTNYVDRVGNAGMDAATQTPGDECSVTVDNTHPTAEYCAEASTNNDNQVAIDGDTVTVTVTISEPATPPTVVCSGVSFTLQAGSALTTEYTYTAVIPDVVPSGAIVCSITQYTDAAGNNGEVAVPEDGCTGVVVDNTHPTSTICVNSINAEFTAGSGDSLLITIDTSEPTTVPSLFCNGREVAITTGVSGDTLFSGTFDVTESDANGPIVCTCNNYDDLPGNSGEDGVPSNEPECATDIVQSPSASNSPTVSPSTSSSITPSNTPSPSPLFSLAIAIDDYNSECVVGDCGYSNEIAILEAEGTRKFGVNVYIFFRIGATEPTSDCIATSDFDFDSFTILCQRLVLPTEFLTPWDPNSMVLFFRPANGGLNNAGVPPVYKVAPNIFAPETFPNASPNTIVAGQVDCAGFEGKTTRLVWMDPLPCWDDPRFPLADGYSTCVPHRAGAAPDGTTYSDGSITQPDLAPYKELLCPLQ